ncbi:MAG: hypothetical protein K5657_05600 [Desulfovibrio sp.]|nr:hypothetical protein [Desulfovibrio sp.]
MQHHALEQMSHAFFHHLDPLILHEHDFTGAFETLSRFGFVRTGEKRSHGPDIAAKEAGETLALFVNRHMREQGGPLIGYDLARLTLQGVAMSVFEEIQEKLGLELDMTIQGGRDGYRLYISDASFEAIALEVALRKEENSQLDFFELISPQTRIVLEECDTNETLLHQGVFMPPRC